MRLKKIDGLPHTLVINAEDRDCLGQSRSGMEHLRSTAATGTAVLASRTAALAAGTARRSLFKRLHSFTAHGSGGRLLARIPSAATAAAVAAASTAATAAAGRLRHPNHIGPGFKAFAAAAASAVQGTAAGSRQRHHPKHSTTHTQSPPVSTSYAHRRRSVTRGTSPSYKFCCFRTSKRSEGRKSRTSAPAAASSASPRNPQTAPAQGSPALWAVSTSTSESPT